MFGRAARLIAADPLGGILALLNSAAVTISPPARGDHAAVPLSGPMEI
jgi:hypothetical protein